MLLTWAEHYFTAVWMARAGAAGTDRELDAGLERALERRRRGFRNALTECRPVAQRVAAHPSPRHPLDARRVLVPGQVQRRAQAWHLLRSAVPWTG